MSPVTSQLNHIVFILLLMLVMVCTTTSISVILTIFIEDTICRVLNAPAPVLRRMFSLPVSLLLSLWVGVQLPTHDLGRTYNEVAIGVAYSCAALTFFAAVVASVRMNRRFVARPG